MPHATWDFIPPILKGLIIVRKMKRYCIFYVLLCERRRKIDKMSVKWRVYPNPRQGFPPLGIGLKVYRITELIYLARIASKVFGRSRIYQIEILVSIPRVGRL
jgi:hypothetical protein